MIGIGEEEEEEKKKKKSKHDYQFVEQERQSLKFFSHHQYQTDTPSTYSINHVSLFAKILSTKQLIMYVTRLNHV